MKTFMKITILSIVSMASVGFSSTEKVGIQGAFGYHFGQTISEADIDIEWCVNSFFCYALNKDSSPHSYKVGLLLNRDGQIYQISTYSTQNNSPECFNEASRISTQLREKHGIEFDNNREEIADYFYYRSWRFVDYDATSVEIEISCVDYTVGKIGVLPEPDKYIFNIKYKDNRYDPSDFRYKNHVRHRRE